MTEDAEWAKLYVFFRQLSDVHKREILKKAKELVTAGGGEAMEEDRQRPKKECVDEYSVQ
jgi:hypothetical protein